MSVASDNEFSPEPVGLDTVFCFAILYLLTEMRMELGLDPDGSLTVERLIKALDQWDVMATAIDAPDGPFDRSANFSRGHLRKALQRYGPVLSRMVLASRAMGRE